MPFLRASLNRSMLLCVNFDGLAIHLPFFLEAAKTAKTQRENYQLILGPDPTVGHRDGLLRPYGKPFRSSWNTCIGGVLAAWPIPGNLSFQVHRIGCRIRVLTTEVFFGFSMGHSKGPKASQNIESSYWAPSTMRPRSEAMEGQRYEPSSHLFYIVATIISRA